MSLLLPFLRFLILKVPSICANFLVVDAKPAFRVKTKNGAEKAHKKKLAFETMRTTGRVDSETIPKGLGGCNTGKKME